MTWVPVYCRAAVNHRAAEAEPEGAEQYVAVAVVANEAAIDFGSGSDSGEVDARFGIALGDLVVVAVLDYRGAVVAMNWGLVF